MIYWLHAYRRNINIIYTCTDRTHALAPTWIDVQAKAEPLSKKRRTTDTKLENKWYQCRANEFLFLDKERMKGRTRRETEPEEVAEGGHKIKAISTIDRILSFNKTTFFHTWNWYKIDPTTYPLYMFICELLSYRWIYVLEPKKNHTATHYDCAWKKDEIKYNYNRMEWM